MGLVSLRLTRPCPVALPHSGHTNYLINSPHLPLQRKKGAGPAAGLLSSLGGLLAGPGAGAVASAVLQARLQQTGSGPS